MPSWSWRVYDRFPDYVNSLVQLADRHRGLCLLFSHTQLPVLQHEKERLLAAVAPHNCTDFAETAGARLYRCE